jgi:Holliday junction DNA helicase RuvA
MIAFLHGAIVEKGADRVVLDVGGVGYLVQVSLHTLSQLPKTGDVVRLLIHSHQAQDSPLALFGFADVDERDLFEHLLSVHGVGPRLAQSMLSGLPPEELATAIASGNVGRLRSIKGVGAKTAERVVLELRQKVTARAQAQEPARPPAFDELVRAIVSLGYKTAEAEKAVQAAETRVPSGAPDAMLREALKQIQAR